MAAAAIMLGASFASCGSSTQTNGGADQQTVSVSKAEIDALVKNLESEFAEDNAVVSAQNDTIIIKYNVQDDPEMDGLMENKEFAQIMLKAMLSGAIAGGEDEVSMKMKEALNKGIKCSFVYDCGDKGTMGVTIDADDLQEAEADSDTDSL